MEQQKLQTKNRGGRPKKAVKRDQLMAIKCTLDERRLIEERAKTANLTVSEYLREIGLTGKIDIREKPFPKEILSLAGAMNHAAANLNQIAKKCNSGDGLNPLDRVNLVILLMEYKNLATRIKSFLQ